MSILVLNNSPGRDVRATLGTYHRFSLRPEDLSGVVDISTLNTALGTSKLLYEAEALLEESDSFYGVRKYALQPFNDFAASPSTGEIALSVVDDGLLISAAPSAGDPGTPTNMVRFYVPKESGKAVMASVEIDPGNMEDYSWSSERPYFVSEAHEPALFSGLIVGSEVFDVEGVGSTAISLLFCTDGKIFISGPPNNLGVRAPYIDAYLNGFDWREGAFEVSILTDPRLERVFVVARRDDVTYNLLYDPIAREAGCFEFSELFPYRVDEDGDVLPIPNTAADQTGLVAAFVVNDSPSTSAQFTLRNVAVFDDVDMFVLAGTPTPGRVFHYASSESVRYFGTSAPWDDTVYGWVREGDLLVSHVHETDGGSHLRRAIADVGAGYFQRQEPRLALEPGFEVRARMYLSVTSQGGSHSTGFGIQVDTGLDLIQLVYLDAGAQTIGLLLDDDLIDRVDGYVTADALVWSVPHDLVIRSLPSIQKLQVEFDGVVVIERDFVPLVRNEGFLEGSGVPSIRIGHVQAGAPSIYSATVKAFDYRLGLSGVDYRYDLVPPTMPVDPPMLFWGGVLSEDGYSYDYERTGDGMRGPVLTIPRPERFFDGCGLTASLTCRLRTFRTADNVLMGEGNSGFGLEFVVGDVVYPVRFLQGSFGNRSVCLPWALGDRVVETAGNSLRAVDVDWTEFHRYELELKIGVGLLFYVDGELKVALHWNFMQSPGFVSGHPEYVFPNVIGVDPCIRFGMLDEGYAGSFDVQAFDYAWGDGFDVEVLPATNLGDFEEKQMRLFVMAEDRT